MGRLTSPIVWQLVCGKTNKVIDDKKKYLIPEKAGTNQCNMMDSGKKLLIQTDWVIKVSQINNCLGTYCILLWERRYFTTLYSEMECHCISYLILQNILYTHQDLSSFILLGALQMSIKCVEEEKLVFHIFSS